MEHSENPEPTNFSIKCAVKEDISTVNLYKMNKQMSLK